MWPSCPRRLWGRRPGKRRTRRRGLLPTRRAGGGGSRSPEGRRQAPRTALGTLWGTRGLRAALPPPATGCPPPRHPAPCPATGPGPQSRTRPRLPSRCWASGEPRGRVCWDAGWWAPGTGQAVPEPPARGSEPGEGHAVGRSAGTPGGKQASVATVRPRLRASVSNDGEDPAPSLWQAPPRGLHSCCPAQECGQRWARRPHQGKGLAGAQSEGAAAGLWRVCGGPSSTCSLTQQTCRGLATRHVLLRAGRGGEQDGGHLSPLSARVCGDDSRHARQEREPGHGPGTDRRAGPGRPREASALRPGSLREAHPAAEGTGRP